MLDVIKKYYKVIVLIVIVGILVLSPLKNYINMNKLIKLLDLIKDTSYAPIIYVLLYIAGVVLALPGIALTILAGPSFGFWKGSLLVIVGSNVGCQITFAISRFMGKDFIKRFIKEEGFADKISKKIEHNGFIVMLYLRLIPIFPFNVVNYISGVTNVKYRHYALASFFGMLPGTLVYVYLSSTAVDVKNNPSALIASIGLLILFTIATTVLKRKQKTLK